MEGVNVCNSKFSYTVLCVGGEEVGVGQLLQRDHFKSALDTPVRPRTPLEPLPHWLPESRFLRLFLPKQPTHHSELVVFGSGSHPSCASPVRAAMPVVSWYRL